MSRCDFSNVQHLSSAGLEVEEGECGAEFERLSGRVSDGDSAKPLQRSAFVLRVVFPMFSTSRSGLEERRVWKGQSFTTRGG